MLGGWIVSTILNATHDLSFHNFVNQTSARSQPQPTVTFEMPESTHFNVLLIGAGEINFGERFFKRKPMTSADAKLYRFR